MKVLLRHIPSSETQLCVTVVEDEAKEFDMNHRAGDYWQGDGGVEGRAQVS